jgi:hypothetical protein
VHDRADDLVQERPVEPEQLPVPRRAPEEAAEHVARALVRRHDPVGDEERHRAPVVGDHAQRHVVPLRRAVALPGELLAEAMTARRTSTM